MKVLLRLNRLEEQSNKKWNVIVQYVNALTQHIKDQDHLIDQLQASNEAQKHKVKSQARRIYTLEQPISYLSQSIRMLAKKV